MNGYKTEAAQLKENIDSCAFYERLIDRIKDFINGKDDPALHRTSREQYLVKDADQKDKDEIRP